MIKIPLTSNMNTPLRCFQFKPFFQLWAVIVFLLLAFKPVFASCLIPSYSAVYDMKAEGIDIGSVTQHFMVKPNKTYVFDSAVHSNIRFFKDVMTESSKGHIGPLGLMPGVYHMINGLSKKYQTVTFDWKRHRAIALSHSDQKIEKKTIKIRSNVQDFLSYQLQIQRALRKNPLSKKVSVYLIHKGSVRHYRYTFLKKEKVKLPLGTVSTALYQRKTQAGETDLWFALKRYSGALVQVNQRVTDKVNMMISLKTYHANALAYCLT